MGAEDSLRSEQERFNAEFRRFLESNLCSDSSFASKVFKSVIEYSTLRGKRIRPLLLVACYKALGGRRNIMPLAVALELLHTSTLIHDDLMDEDNERGGIRSVHAASGSMLKTDASKPGSRKNAVFRNRAARGGASSAIVAGNMLYALGLASLLSFKCSDSIKVKLSSLYNEAYAKVNEGQLLDIQSEFDANFSERQYFSMVEKKTSALLELAYLMAAAVAGRSHSAIASFVKDIGTAFQMIDDIKDLSESAKGRATNKGIALKKRTLLRIIYEESHGSFSSSSEAFADAARRVAGKARKIVEKALRRIQEEGLQKGPEMLLEAIAMNVLRGIPEEFSPKSSGGRFKEQLA